MGEVSPDPLVHVAMKGRLAIHESTEKSNFIRFGERTESLFVHTAYLFLDRKLEVMDFLSPQLALVDHERVVQQGQRLGGYVRYGSAALRPERRGLIESQHEGGKEIAVHRTVDASPPGAVGGTGNGNKSKV